MVTPRDVLNRFKWKDGEDIGEASVYYVHRGAPGDSKVISGADIVKLEKFCFELATGTCSWCCAQIKLRAPCTPFRLNTSC